MIELDGRIGGGQMLRTALACSVLTGKAFTMTNVRSSRDNPGLRPQHMASVQAAATFCKNVIIEGCEEGSQILRFVPGTFRPKSQEIDIGTAGSVTLLLQAVLPALIVGKKAITLDIKGGTDVQWSMPCDYLKEVLLPHLEKYATIKLELIRRGYYPKGGGHLRLYVKPRYTYDSRDQATPFYVLDQGTVLQVKGISHASTRLQERRVAERQADAARLQLKLDVPVDIQSHYADTLSDGSGITLWSINAIHQVDTRQPIRLGAAALGARGIPAEKVGFGAAITLKHALTSSAPVDRHLADNLIPYLGIFGGKIRVEEMTDHVRTNIRTVSAFFGEIFTIQEDDRIIQA